MASAEHCLMCFEALDAHLDDRKPLSLDRVQSSWAAYSSSGSSLPAGASAPRDAALRRVAADSDSSSTSSLGTPASGSTPATSTSSLPLGPTSTPLFVTWNTVSDVDDVSLRGCIGTFEAQPLSLGIPEYAVISAVHDSRFPPISRDELPTLQAAVTLLTDFEELDDPYDWEIGTHGIRLSFQDRARRYGSTYLPDVAAEQGWTKDETLFSLTRKAGWMGSRSRWQDLDLKVTRYRGKKCSMEYPEYKKWKDWAAASKQ
ncbi:AMME syndrome candidate [Tolypocladium paradoxum]|uniref:AMME syndrome candidate n=1 Tax=Tolypocladium paradoxum TaxID=94208 RepID=A0A2S4KN47_9HYPO|nr:AMME syndrome candidate [Tolypocladium paradoxum]